MKFRQQVRKSLDQYLKGYYLEKYIIRDGKTHPVAIICPGGGYHWVVSFNEGMPYAEKLNKMGVSAVVVHYRCGEKYPYPTPQDDLARAVRTVLRNAKRWNLDVDGYSVWGSSAGGHLAASFGTENMGYKKYGLPKPGALVLVYPVITMQEASAHAGSRKQLLGAESTEEMRHFASIEKQVSANYPPTFVWCGLADGTVDPENSRMMAEALQNAGVEYRYFAFEGVNHAVGVGEGTPCEGWLEDAAAFWLDSRQKQSM